MALTTLTIAVLMVTVASAAFSSSFWDDNNEEFESPSMSFRYLRALPLPEIPRLPGFSNIELPDPPSLQFPSLNFPKMRPFPKLPSLPSLPTVEGIANQGAIPGSNYIGAAVISQSTGTRDDNGNIIRKGGSTVMLNDNGELTVQEVGDAPPVVITKTINPPFSDFKQPKFKHDFKFGAPKHNFPDMKPPKFKPVPAMNPDSIKNYVPKKGETFIGSHHSSSSYSSDVNGVKSGGAEITSIINDNGAIDQQNLAYHKGPK